MRDRIAQLATKVIHYIDCRLFDIHVFKATPEPEQPYWMTCVYCSAKHSDINPTYANQPKEKTLH